MSLGLRCLVLSRNDIGDEGATRIARALGASRKLERLEMASCGICDAGATALASASSPLLDANSQVRRAGKARVRRG